MYNKHKSTTIISSYKSGQHNTTTWVVNRCSHAKKAKKDCKDPTYIPQNDIESKITSRCQSYKGEGYKIERVQYKEQNLYRN